LIASSWLDQCIIDLIAGKQLGFDDYEQTTAKKRTKREKFLPDMDQVVPLRAVVELIEPHYPRTGSKGERQPHDLATMLRIHRMQQWYWFIYAAMEDVLGIRRALKASALAATADSPPRGPWQTRASSTGSAASPGLLLPRPRLAEPAGRPYPLRCCPAHPASV